TDPSRAFSTGAGSLRRWSRSAPEVLVEERQDPPPRVLGRRMVVIEGGEPDQRRQHRPDVDPVQEAVARSGYSLMSCTTPRSDSVSSSGCARPRSIQSRAPKLATI